MHAHVVLVSERLHAHRALALASLDAIFHAFVAHDVPANGDDGVLDVAAAIAIHDGLRTC